MPFDRLPSKYQCYEDDEERIEFHVLRRAIQQMSVRSKLYRLLKEELTARGWWKNRPRGVPGNLQTNRRKHAE